MKYNTKNTISSIKRALNKMQKSYSRTPLYFINERDVQSRVYAELFKVFNKPRKVQVNEFRKKKWIKTQINHKTIPLHVELYQDHRNGKTYKKWKGRFVDLGIVLDNESLIVTAKHKGREGSNSFYGKPDWNPNHAVGIEIKFNDWCFKETREKENGKWESFKGMVHSDLDKLNDYKRGIFILVDRECIFSSKDQWYEFIHELMPKSYRDRRLQNIKAYYLSPSTHKIIFTYGSTR